MGEARAAYFARYGLPADGGYDERWTPLRFGPVTLHVYNGAARRRAVRLHDLHHVVTGYHADPPGEAEISAWEFGAGIHDKHFARLINLGALLYGGWLYPQRTWRAYLRGRRSRSLYSGEFDPAILDTPVVALRAKLLPTTPAQPRARDVAHYLVLLLVANVPLIAAALGVTLLLR